MHDMLNEIVISLGIFLPAEEAAYHFQLWQAVNVKHRFSNVAIYILPAEAILGPVIFYAYRKTEYRSILIKIVAAFIVMLIYTGAATLSYLLIEKTDSLQILGD